MPRGKPDDTLYDRPKVEQLGDQEGDPACWKVAGIGLLTLAISWCNRHLTDGHISLRQIAKLADLTVDRPRRSSSPRRSRPARAERCGQRLPDPRLPGLLEVER